MSPAVIHARPIAKTSSRVQRLQRTLGLTQSEMAAILEVSPKTLGRRALKPSEAERVSILEQIAQVAAQIVPTPHLARWFDEPKVYLGNAAPKALLGSERGRRALEAYLLSLADSAVL